MASGPLRNLLRAQMGYADRGQELRLPLAARLGFLSHGPQAFRVLSPANLLLGLAFRLENGFMSRLTNVAVVALLVLLANEAATGAFAGEGPSICSSQTAA